jgi:hypothetical protein
MERQKNNSNSSLNPENKITRTLLFKGESKYSQIARFDATMIGYLSERHNPIADEGLLVMDGVQRPVVRDNAGMLRRVNAPANNLMFKINGVEAQDIRSQQATQSTRSARAGNSLFGSTVTFSLSRANAEDEDETAANSGMLRSSASTGEEITMYVPELVEILSPRVNKAEDLLPYCYYRNFTLKWNADPQNQNGLVVAVEWNGSDIFGKRYGEYVINVDILPHDNGSAILNDRMFEGIPQGAIANLILLRGNIEILEGFINEHGAEEAYRIVAASEATLPFIIVKEITVID